MVENNAKMCKIIVEISVAVMSVLAVLSAYVSFISPENPSAITRFVASPFYVGLWILLAALWVFFLWVSKPGQTRPFLFTHLTLILLIGSVILTKMTTETQTVYLLEGEPVQLSDMGQTMGLNLPEDISITLERFNKSLIVTNDKELLFYTSELLISNRGEIYQADIELNHPLKIGGVSFYQSSWHFQVRDFVIEFGGEEYNIVTDGDFDLIDSDGNEFFFMPVDMNNRKISYVYQLISPQGAMLETGSFESGDVPDDLPERFGFKILVEDVPFVSILQMKSAPFNIVAAIASVLFLMALAYELWIRKKPETLQQGGVK